MSGEAPGARGERTRARLLAVAVRRFAADGFRRTSLSAVAEEAGVSPAAVYAYFPSKEGLFEAAVDADAAALIGEAKPQLEGATAAAPGQPMVPLPALIEAVGRHPLARRVLSGQEPEVIHRLLALPALLDLRRRIAEAIGTGQDAGVVRPDVDPKTLAVGFETLVLALLIAVLQVPDYGEERAAGVEALFDAVLRPPPPRS